MPYLYHMYRSLADPSYDYRWAIEEVRLLIIAKRPETYIIYLRVLGLCVASQIIALPASFCEYKAI
jgi:hypothetical protein